MLKITFVGKFSATGRVSGKNFCDKKNLCQLSICGMKIFFISDKLMKCEKLTFARFFCPPTVRRGPQGKKYQESYSGDNGTQKKLCKKK